MTRPDPKSLIGRDPKEVPMSLQRIAAASSPGVRHWIGPKDGKKLSKDDLDAYDIAHKIMAHLCIQAPTKHKSGHPGGPLSAFTFTYFVHKRRNPEIDPPFRMSAGHLSLLAYGMQWLMHRGGRDPRLASPKAIIESFRKPDGLPGHVEAGIGDIPFGFGPLGKGVSNALGVAFGLTYLSSLTADFNRRVGTVDVLIGDGDCQEGQVMEAVRLASHLRTGNLMMHGDFNDIQLSGIPSRTVAADFAAIVAAAGWTVIEVQNGNDPAQVVAALDLADSLRGEKPIFICYYTTMGHGVKIMEEGSNTTAANYHGSPLKDDVAAAALKDLPSLDQLTKSYEKFRPSPSPVPVPSALPFSLKNLKGYARSITSEKGAARQDFGAVHLKNLMKSDSRIVVLHGDLAGSGGFDKVAADFNRLGEIPRVINVGVAEANMYMMAAGMRQAGLLPVTYTFAAFGTNEARANARLIDVNCGHTHCGVLHDCTHAGLSVGEDGETHQERNYLNLPFDHTQVWMLADSNQAAAAAERAMEIVAEGSQSIYAFFPRSGHEQLKTPSGEIIYGKDYSFDGKIDIVRGAGDITDDVTIIATGIPVHDAIAAADQLSSAGRNARPQEPGAGILPAVNVRVLNVSCIRPLDASAIIQAALETSHLIVVEDHHSEGGLASQVADVIADFQLPCSLRRLGVNRYFPSGTDKDLKFLAGLDCDSIIDAALDDVRAEVRSGEDAFVTVIHSLLENGKKSRFAKTAQPFIDRLIGEKGYLDALRKQWEKRTISTDKFPTNATLLRRLQGNNGDL